ncbi:MAG: heparinase, partial [Chloroflexota bacterium]|nr:heparinase [Chloroflexota bacterium]
MRWLRTVRYLRPVQIIGRLWIKAYRPRPDLSPAPGLRALSGQWYEPVQKRPTLLQPWRFRFLNVEHDLAGPADWNNPARDTLWLYNLHYFDDLNAESAATRVEWHRELLSRWVAENPPTRGVGWAPYPTSLRIVNWIKWSLAGNTLPDECRHSLAVQTRWLKRRLEYHLLGNHLFAN